MLNFKIKIMKKSQLFCLIILLSLAMSIISSCKKDDDDDNDNSKSLINSWTKLMVADTNFNVKLTFNGNGTFTWTMIDSVPGHTNSGGEFSYNETQITYFNDPDCTSNGIYDYVICENKLILILVEDNCTPRIPAIIGVWLLMN